MRSSPQSAIGLRRVSSRQPMRQDQKSLLQKSDPPAKRGTGAAGGHEGVGRNRPYVLEISCPAGRGNWLKVCGDGKRFSYDALLHICQVYSFLWTSAGMCSKTGRMTNEAIDQTFV